MSISVLNPLSMTVTEMPALLDLQDVKLVQMKMDRGTTAWKVFMLAGRVRWAHIDLAGRSVKILEPNLLRFVMTREVCPSL